MLPVQITFKDLPTSPTIEAHIHQKLEKLERFSKEIISCHIVIESPQKHKHKGKLYNFKITINGHQKKEFVATHHSNEDIYIAIKDAFDAIYRQLSENLMKRRSPHKHAEDHVLRGQIVRLVPNEGYGFIEGLDGNEYYFNQQQFEDLPQFKQLMIGDSVDFMSLPLKDGLQAHHIIKV